MTEDVPPLLFKYFPPQRTELWSSNLLRFSRRQALNDPFEFSAEPDVGSLAAAFEHQESIWDRTAHSERLRRLFPHLSAEQVDETVEKTLEEMKRRREELPQDLFRELKDEAENQLLVFSCTSERDCVPMWAHYTANHTGYQIGFSPLQLFPQNTRGRSYPLVPRRMRYVTETPKVEANDRPIFDFALQKLADWDYEKEWRYLSKLDAADFRCDGLGYFLFDRSAIQEVTFGIHADERLITEVLTAIRAHHLSCSVYRTTSPSGQFGIVRESI